MSPYGQKCPCRQPLVGPVLHHLFTFVSPPFFFPSIPMKATLKSTLTFSLFTALVSLGLAGCSKQEAPSPAPPTEAITSTAALFALDQIAIGNPIPAGWVIVRATNSHYTIQFVHGAPYGTSLQVVSGSPVPNGWVIIAIQRTSWGAVFNRIECLKGAPVFAEAQVVTDSPIPIGWAIIRTYQTSLAGVMKTIRNLKGALRGTEVQVVSDSPIPSGWVIIATYRTPLGELMHKIRNEN
jgi:hypothetical protein